MKIKVPNYFNEFKCIGSDCPDTCCAGWGIVVDDDSYNKYSKVKGDFGDRLRENMIIDEDGERVFTLKGDKNCSFLNENKLCDIYSEIGEESLCYTCRQYPRYLEEFGKLRETGISLSCPEAARIILEKDEKVSYEVSENDEEIDSYHDIDGLFFLELMNCRALIFRVLNREDITLNKKLSIILIMAKEIQDYIDNGENRKVALVKERYLKEETIQDLLIKLDRPKDKMKYTYMKEYFNVIKNLEHFKEDPLNLKDHLKVIYGENNEEFYIEKDLEFNEFYKEKYFKFKNISVYYIYRYLMKSIYDFDFIGKVKYTILAYLIIRDLSMKTWIQKGTFENQDLIDISYMYSRDIEHFEENVDILGEIFETNDKFNLEDILSLLND